MAAEWAFWLFPLDLPHQRPSYSPTGRRNGRPMTGSGVSSTPRLLGSDHRRSEYLVVCPPRQSDGGQVAGDDDWICLRDLAAHCARVAARILRPRKKEGAGSRRALHPRSVATCTNKCARAYRFSEAIRHSRAMLYGLCRVSCDELSCHRHRRPTTCPRPVGLTLSPPT